MKKESPKRREYAEGFTTGVFVTLTVVAAVCLVTTLVLVGFQ